VLYKHKAMRLPSSSAQTTQGPTFQRGHFLHPIAALSSSLEAQVLRVLRLLRYHLLGMTDSSGRTNSARSQPTKVPYALYFRTRLSRPQTMSDEPNISMPLSRRLQSRSRVLPARVKDRLPSPTRPRRRILEKSCRLPALVVRMWTAEEASEAAYRAQRLVRKMATRSRQAQAQSQLRRNESRARRVW
jgi:hypothetical protein